MKKLILTIAFLVAGSRLLLGNTDPVAQQLLVAAEQQASLFRDQARPLQLDVDFLAQMNVPARGHLTLKWAALDRWWRRIVMGDFEQIDVRNGDALYTSRNMSFTPVRVQELISLIQFAEGSEKLVAKKEKKQVKDGVEISCLQVDGYALSKRHSVCVNPASLEILSDEWQMLPDEHRKEKYADYFDFEGRRYPHKLELLVNGISVVTANVGNLTAAAFDPTLLVKPKGAIERRQCADMKLAVPVKTPDPMYPQSFSQNKLEGDTTVAMTILSDGSVTDIRLVGTATHSMDDATLQTLKGWKFKPAMCGADPVVTDIEVVVSFRLR